MNEVNHQDYRGDFDHIPVRKDYHEGGAHFKASELFMKLIELQKEVYLYTKSTNANTSRGKDRGIILKKKPKQNVGLTTNKEEISKEGLPFLNHIQQKKLNNKVLPVISIQKKGNQYHHQRKILSYCQNNQRISYVFIEPNDDFIPVNNRSNLNNNSQSISLNIIYTKSLNIPYQDGRTRNLKAIALGTKPQISKLTLQKKKLPRILKRPLILQASNVNQSSYYL